MLLNKTRQMPFPPSLSNPSKKEFLHYFKIIWNRYEWLFSCIDQNDNAFEFQPNPFRNSLAFYYGHTASFYIQKLRIAGLISKPISAVYDEALEKGVWPKNPDEISIQNWPSFSELKVYREQVFETVLSVIEQSNFDEAITAKHPLWALIMGIEHEAIHFQTSIPLIRQMPIAWISNPDNVSYAPVLSKHEIKHSWISFSGGKTSFGRSSNDHNSFGWDNEYGEVNTEVSAFSVMNLPITNRMFLEFIDDGGYNNKKLWTTVDVDCWFETMNVSHPAAWIRHSDDSYSYRALFNEISMPWDWPVEVNRHEAVAFANWSQARLLKETEFNYLLKKEFGGYKNIQKNLHNFNINMKFSSPTTVGYFENSLSKNGLDLIGNVARWMEEDFSPLCNKTFQPHSFYQSFSKPWFRGDHGVMLGAGFSAIGHLAEVGIVRDFM